MRIQRHFITQEDEQNILNFLDDYKTKRVIK